MKQIHEISEVPEKVIGLKGVIFDLDDTLYGEKEYVRCGYRAIAKMPQFRDKENIEGKLWDAFERGLPAIDTVLAGENLLTEALKKDVLATYRNQMPELHFYPEAEAVLVKLRQAGYKLGIITDGRPEGQWAKIKALGLKNLVDDIIVTDELGGISYRKPNPEAFVQIQRRWDIPFTQLCYVGDNPKKDPIAPERLGMEMLLFRNPDGLYFEKNKA